MIPDWLTDYRAEVLRWNASINLVSRVQTEERLDALMGQCLDAGRRLVEARAPLGIGGGHVEAYFDLGSGGGLPGLAWHGLLIETGAPPQTFLVEPREKRAWFLERTARSLEPAPEILQGRWGDVGIASPGVQGKILISLKALYLDDLSVLSGLASMLGPGTSEVLIARFHPADQAWDRDLREHLALPDPGTRRSVGSREAEAVASGLLPPSDSSIMDAAGLVVSRYLLPGD